MQIGPIVANSVPSPITLIGWQVQCESLRPQLMIAMLVILDVHRGCG
jgi:hypothetical protein